MLIKKHNNCLIDFLKGSAPNSQGIYIYDMWNWDYLILERKHNYIQWLFPLKERSNYYWFAPVINDFNITHINNNKLIKDNMIRSLKVMLDFYGYEIGTKETISIYISDHFYERSRFWISKNNHNYLRITRIIKSLCLANLNVYALAFNSILQKLKDSEFNDLVGTKTFEYWSMALINSIKG